MSELEHASRTTSTLPPLDPATTHGSSSVLSAKVSELEAGIKDMNLNSSFSSSTGMETKVRKSVKIVSPQEEEELERLQQESSTMPSQRKDPRFSNKSNQDSKHFSHHHFRLSSSRKSSANGDKVSSRNNKKEIGGGHSTTAAIDDHEDGPFAYRHYYAYQPTANKLLSKKWEERNRTLHLKKLREVKPTIDNSPPKVYPHLEMRLKKLKLEEDRLVNIQRQNQILLDRIAFQMVKFSDVGKATEELPITKIAKTMYTDKRKRKENIIMIQNQEISQRIESKLPFYNRYEWLADRRRNLGYLRNISEYPKQYCKLIDEFDANDRLVKLTKLASRLGTRARTASPSRLNRHAHGEQYDSEYDEFFERERPRTSQGPTKSALKKQSVAVTC